MYRDILQGTHEATIEALSASQEKIDLLQKEVAELKDKNTLLDTEKKQLSTEIEKLNKEKSDLELSLNELKNQTNNATLDNNVTLNEKQIAQIVNQIKENTESQNERLIELIKQLIMDDREASKESIDFKEYKAYRSILSNDDFLLILTLQKNLIEKMEENILKKMSETKKKENLKNDKEIFSHLPPEY